jgi:hypothetical protein
VCRPRTAALECSRTKKSAHGGFTAGSLALKREVQALARLAHETMAAIGPGLPLPADAGSIWAECQTSPRTK